MKSSLLCALGWPVLLAGCTATPSVPANTGSKTTSIVVKDSITGTVAYRERIALPPTAVVRVQLQDASRQDVATTVVDSVTLRPNGRQVPLPFTLHYDTARVQQTHTYSVQARITDGNQVLFRTDVAYPVLTRGNPKRVELLLRRVSN